jgi:hypothetical protein
MPATLTRRRWAVIRLAPWAVIRRAPNTVHPTIIGTYWWRMNADNMCRLLGTPDGFTYQTTPTDGARYTDRAATIAAILHQAPRSVAGIAWRTAMTPHGIQATLLRMAREHRVIHRSTFTPDGPGRGVWRNLTPTERATTPQRTPTR